METEGGAEKYGGYLSVTGREAAISSVLLLLGSYFAGGSSFSLENQSIGLDATEKYEQNATDNLEGLRLRVALASSARLAGIVNDIRTRSNFRYAVRRHNSIGHLSGQLDVPRWAIRRHERRAPVVYPIRKVQRSSATPENILATYALLWCQAELEDALAVAAPPDGGPESVRAAVAFRELLELSQQPPFFDCLSSAQQVGQRSLIQNLLDQVERRLDAGHVSNPEPYRELSSWIALSLQVNPQETGGEINWVFYGKSFDSTLFELWCMHNLASTISDSLGTPRMVPNMRQGRSLPVYVWETLTGKIEIYYQRSLQAFVVGNELVWADTSNQKPLGGRPDMTVLTRLNEGGEKMPGSTVYVDPKLRQRGKPTEEIYKMLGYFSNSGDEAAGRGAIIYYEPNLSVAPIYQYSSKSGGMVLALGLDPSKQGHNKPALQTLANMILEAHGVPDGVPISESDSQEEVESARERFLVAELVALCARIGNDGLQQWMNMIKIDLAEFNLLSNDHQRFLASALYAATLLSSDADYSGPVVGFGKAVEGCLRERLLFPVSQIRPEVARKRMLGQVIRMIKEATTLNPSDADSRAVRNYLLSNNVDIAALALTVPYLESLNALRTSAAHPDPVSHQDWVNCLALVLREPAHLLEDLIRLLP
ncbi:hypothetical protein ACIO1C_05135 [Streptomyces sp. NPDC087420]|uniref:hypothetical protein n=1 Tax=Streptomyces sp. NPDC087420 TaxID=3365785 RepID=UPI0038361482